MIPCVGRTLSSLLLSIGFHRNLSVSFRWGPDSLFQKIRKVTILTGLPPPSVKAVADYGSCRTRGFAQAFSPDKRSSMLHSCQTDLQRFPRCCCPLSFCSQRHMSWIQNTQNYPRYLCVWLRSLCVLMLKIVESSVTKSLVHLNSVKLDTLLIL